MRTAWLIAVAVFATFDAGMASVADYVYSDAFETRVCDGVDCMYCSPLDPQPLCGTHSHCVPQQNATSMCTYPSGGGTQGALCSDDAGCAGPFACIQTQNLACRQWCERPAGSCPAAGTSCVSFMPALMIGGQEWGVCL